MLTDALALAGALALTLAVALTIGVSGAIAVAKLRGPPVTIPPPAPVEVERPPEPAVVEAPRQLPVLPPDPRSRWWVAVVTAAAPLAAIGMYVHHRRFVEYHRHKGSEAKTTFSSFVASETRGAGILAAWHVRGFLRDGLRVPANPQSRPVVCIHGYTQNATNFHGLRQALEAHGHPTVAVSLGYRLAPLAWYAHRLERKLDALVARHPDGIDVVAHSMGGVVLRMVLVGRPDLRESIRTVVTLGTPHRGTAAARGFAFLPELRALTRRSSLLAELPQLPALLPHGRVVTIAGDADTIVYPVETSLVTGAQKIVLPGIGHSGLLTAPEAWDAVRSALVEPSRVE